MSQFLHRLLITPGDPAGIGPDITLAVAQQSFDAEIFVIADPDLLTERAQLLGIQIQLNIFDTLPSDVIKHVAGQLNILPMTNFPSSENEEN